MPTQLNWGVIVLYHNVCIKFQGDSKGNFTAFWSLALNFEMYVKYSQRQSNISDQNLQYEQI